MIKSKKDYLHYLNEDRKYMYLENMKRPRIFMDHVWRYTRVMRKVEYYVNCKKGFLSKLIEKFYKFRLYRLSLKTGFSIPHNVFGAGLVLFHHGTIIVNKSAKIGEKCQLFCCTNIGANVEIGSRAFIAPGVKILDNVKIADGVKIGANSVVSRDILEPNVVVVGAPAKKIKDRTDIIY